MTADADTIREALREAAKLGRAFEPHHRRATDAVAALERRVQELEQALETAEGFVVAHPDVKARIRAVLVAGDQGWAVREARRVQEEVATWPAWMRPRKRREEPNP